MSTSIGLLGLESTVSIVLDRHCKGSGDYFLRAIANQGNGYAIGIEHLNRYFRSVICSAPAEATKEALESLCTSVDFGVWLKNFEQFVIPVLKKYNLLGVV